MVCFVLSTSVQMLVASVRSPLLKKVPFKEIILHPHNQLFSLIIRSEESDSSKNLRSAVLVFEYDSE